MCDRRSEEVGEGKETDRNERADVGDPLMTHPQGEPAPQTDTLAFNDCSQKLKDEELGNDVTSTGSHDMEDRGNWGGKLEFIFTCIGYAVGLGNVWRFPYLCYKNGGGAFLVPYVIMLTAVGLPLFFMEIAFGQFASLGPITIWKVSPLFKGLGYAMVSISCIMGIYYNVIISHVLLYLMTSIAAIWKGYLPWITCDNPWNTPNCIRPVFNCDEVTDGIDNVTRVACAMTNVSRIGNLSDVGNMTSDVINATQATVTGAGNLSGTNASKGLATAAEEYYYNYILEMSTGIEEANGINWKLALCLLAAWSVVLVCLIRGIQSLGKIAYFTALFPYLMLTILLIRGATLPGASKGIEYYVKPDFTRLGDARVWCDAATQIFYSLSACLGGLIAMSSFNKFNNNCLRDAVSVAIINCGTSIYAGFVIFSVLGFMATEKGVEVKDVAAGGPGLVFVVYPEALSRMPVPQLWAIFFFIMMATLGFGSQLSIVEGVLSALTDEFPKFLRRTAVNYIFRVTIILTAFLLGLPMVTRGGMYLINLVDYSISGLSLLTVGFFECFVLNWVYGTPKFCQDIEMMLGRKLNLYWRTTWRYISPAVLLVTLFFNIISYKPPSMENYAYPVWAEVLGWMIAIFPLSIIVVLFLYRYCGNGGYKVLKVLMAPSADWGPALPANRMGHYLDDMEDISKFSAQSNLIYKPQTTQFPSVESVHRADSQDTVRYCASPTKQAFLSDNNPCKQDSCI